MQTNTLAKTQSLRVHGGHRLSGDITITPNKNAILPIICTTLLTSELCILKSVPKSPDVLKILEAITELGGSVVWSDETTLEINCSGILSKPVSDCVSDIQSAILFVGPLLARFGHANVPSAIGCKLGYRGPEDHIDYLSRLGAESTFKDGRVHFTVDRSRLKSYNLVQITPETIIKTFIFSEASVTPTENLLMFLSCVTQFDVKLVGIAHEPHVEFLIRILRDMGMTILGEGTVLYVKGCLSALKGFECDFSNEPDHVDFYGTAVAVVLTQSNVFLSCRPTYAIQTMVEFLVKSGVHCKITQGGVQVNALAEFSSDGGFVPLPGFSRANERTWKLNPRPWPGFPVDCLPSFIALTCANTQEETATTVNNWMYEDGLSYVAQLRMLGADTHTIPTDLGAQKVFIRGQEQDDEGNYFADKSGALVAVDGVPVIEGTRALFIAALARTGETVIRDISPLLRRSPDFIDKFCELGAKIELIPD